MRALYTGVILLGIVFAAEAKKPRGKLECSSTDMDGKKLKVPGKHLRLEEPVVCKLSVTESDPGYIAEVRTRWSELDDKGVKQKKEGGPHSGGVAADKPLEVRLLESKDFVACLDFTIDARIVDDQGKASWKKSVKVKQFCPD